MERSERTAANESADKIRPPKSAPKIEAKSDPLAEPSSKSKKNVENEGKKRKRIKVFSDSEESGTGKIRNGYIFIFLFGRAFL